MIRASAQSTRGLELDVLDSWWRGGGAAAWAPPERVLPDVWADRCRVLTRRTSSEPGPWRTDRVPYLRAPMRWWIERPWLRRMVLCASAQIGKSELLYTLLGYVVDVDPGPTLVVVPRDADVENMGDERIKPAFEESPQLRAHITGWASDWKRRRLTFDTCNVYLAASNSPAELASRPVRYLFGDETEKWPGYAGNDAPPLNLARERQHTFEGSSRELLVSTPLDPRGLIWTELQASHVHRYHVPCPLCGAFQVLTWDRVELGGEDPDQIEAEQLARYRCRACEELFDDRSRRAMLLAGVWVPDGGELLEDGTVVDPKPYAPNVGLHLWRGYSPWSTWSKIAAEFLRSQSDPAKMKAFVTNTLGEPWEETTAEPTRDLVRACIGKHKRDEVPDGVEVLTAGVDVQQDRMFYVVHGWGRDLESWLVRAGSTSSWEELANMLCRGSWGGDRALTVRATCIDSRHRRDEVQDFARQWSESVRLILGVELDSPKYWTTHRIDKHPVTGATLAASLVEWHLNVGLFKDQVAACMETAGRDGPKGLHLPADASDELIKHLSSEHKVTIRRAGSTRERWKPRAGHRQNHWWDALVYAFAAARMVYVHTLRGDATAATDSSSRARRSSGGGGWTSGGRRRSGSWWRR